MEIKIHIRGKDITVKSFELGDHIELAKIIRAERVKEIKEHMYGLPLNLCLGIWEASRREITEIEAGSTRYRIECLKMDSVANALVLAVKKVLPDFTIAEAIKEMNLEPEKLVNSIVFEILCFDKTT